MLCSPTFIFYKDKLLRRNFPDSIHRAFFKALDMCGVLHQPIMLLVEKRFHIENPIDGGTQQLYNILWDYDLSPERQECIVTSENDEMESRSQPSVKPTSYNPPKVKDLHKLDKWRKWRNKKFNPDMPDDGIWLSRKTVWL